MVAVWPLPFEASKTDSADIKTRASWMSWDQSGRYPLTAQMVSGVEAA
jgi:hypothetical protein